VRSSHSAPESSGTQQAIFSAGGGTSWHGSVCTTSATAETLYVRIGDVFAWTCLLVALAALLVW
jgi:apolipoprotein N-acyltransferase